MKIVRRRWIILTIGVCSVALLWSLLYMVEFQCNYIFPAKSERNNVIVNDTLMDLEHFEYIMNNASICESFTSADRLSIVILVHSARSHFMARYAIRNTWGSIKVYKQWSFRLVFLLGIDATSNMTGLSKDEVELWQESRRHGDMIMGNFVDSYKNLTYKHLMGYKWAHTFCSNAKFILKTDDDIFVDIFQLVEVLLVEFINSGMAYACQNMGGNKPIRDPTNVWYVSKDAYSGEWYPDFCSGSVYLIKSQAAAKIYSVSNQTTFFWIDDVYVTGILREYYNNQMDNSYNERLGILTLNDRYNMSCKNEIRRWCIASLHDQMQYTFVLLHKVRIVHDMFCVWNKVRLLKFAMNNAIASNNLLNRFTGT